MSGTAGAGVQTPCLCLVMPQTTAIFLIPSVAGDGKYQSGAHGAGFRPPVSDVRTDTAGPDAHSLCSDGWNPACRKGESRKRDFSRVLSPPKKRQLMINSSC